jgi:Protein of unknown function with PCYCGC motif
MINHRPRTIVLLASLLTPALLSVLAASPGTQTPAAPPVVPNAEMCAKQAAPVPSGHAYHKEPPVGPLPETLDPKPFLAEKRAFVAYSIAAKIRELLYQEPCYCPCDKVAGHKSLLDCFTSTHGYGCRGCQSQVFFIYERSKEGKSPGEIREAMEKREMWKLDPTKYAEQHFKEYAGDAQ